MELGDLISMYRKESGLTIDELVCRSGVPKGTITKILGNVTKAPSLDTVRAIAHALGRTLADFDDASAPVVNDLLKEQLLEAFDQLNQEGQELVVQYARFQISEGYIKTHSPDLVEDQA